MDADDTATFESQRAELLALAYRMLGELARAEEVVQDAWLRWQGRAARVDSPKAFLLTTVARLCIDELDSARARREESRSDRLPEPVDLDASGIGRVEMLDQISMAFLVLLQRLTASERAVLLLHDVFDMSHAEIGAMLHKTDAACRQLLKSARHNVATERRALKTSPDQHQKMLSGFVQAISGGDSTALMTLLAEDAVLIADGGPGIRRFGRVRNIGRPVVGRQRIVSLINAFRAQEPSSRLVFAQRMLNGQAAALALLDGIPLAAISIAVAGGQIRRVFFQGDPERLQHLGVAAPASA